MINQGTVGFAGTSLGDSLHPDIALGKQGEQLAVGIHGDFYTQSYRGRLFRGTTAAAGVVLATNNSTAPTFGIWNPSGSNINVVLVRFKAGYNVTTGLAGNILYANLANAGSSIGTAAPISAITRGVLGTTVFPGVIGSNAAPVATFVPATATLTAAGTIIGTSGFSQLVTTAATTGAGMWQLVDNFNGEMIIAPGNFWYPIGSAALATTWNLELSWYEAPL